MIKKILFLLFLLGFLVVLTFIITRGNSSQVQITIPKGASLGGNFTPGVVQVVIGINNTVMWINEDESAHTVTSLNGTFDSGLINQYSSFSYTFSSPGIYFYYCKPHPWMKGVIIVKTAE